MPSHKKSSLSVDIVCMCLDPPPMTMDTSGATFFLAQQWVDDGTKSQFPHPLRVGKLAIAKTCHVFSTKYILSKVSIYITKSPQNIWNW